jgi:E3 ubiquitin-protein ligase SHPRH
VVKHVNMPDFKCIVYESSCSMDPFELAAADVVITTYEVLRKDFHHREILNKQLRHERRFISCKTPLLGVAWKRVILDEAQMVECSTAMASEMACNLVSKFRWCVTGTPVLRGLSDIEGLMTFLRVPLFCERLYWKSRIEVPISRGDQAHMENVFRFLRSICWRTSMTEAISRNELNIRPPEQHLRLHELRTIERVFYSRQHDTCMTKAREVLAVCRQRGWTELDSSMAADAMRPLLLLRQACCHPQVGSSWLRNTSGPNKTLGMHEILAQVIKKARVEAQEGKRKIVYALNGVAGIACLLGAFDQAALLYCDAIEVAEDQTTSTQTSVAAEYSTVVVYDKLQMLHAAHNLQDVTSRSTNVMDSSLEALSRLRKAKTRPVQLPEFLSRAQSLAKRNEALYVQESHSRFSISESELDVLSREIPASLNTIMSWALSSLQPISLGLGEDELVSRAKALASPSQDPGNTSLLGVFNSAHGLSLVLSNAWDKLVRSRDRLQSIV